LHASTTTSAEPLPPARLNSLTGIRFVAAAIVFGFHAQMYLGGGLFDVLGGGLSGVSLFYILSGFVMSWTFRPTDKPRLFYQRRFARIYPAYFLSVSAAILAAVVKGDFRVSDLSAYTLLQAWSPDPHWYYAANPVFWSLSCEAFFYIIFPLVVRPIARLGTRGLAVLAASSMSMVILIGLATMEIAEDPIVHWATYVFPPTRSIEFILGIALGFLVRRDFRIQLPTWAAGSVATAAVLAAAWCPDSTRIAAVTIVPFVLLVLVLASNDLNGSTGVMGSRSAVALGAWSFCFYLIHVMVQGWVVKLTAPPLLPLAGVVLALILAIVGAWLMHRVIELPAERALRPQHAAPRLDAD